MTGDKRVPKERTDEKLCIFNVSREAFLSLGVSAADTHWARLRGLLGRVRLPSDEGLWLVPCQGVHTLGLLFPIDVIYLDAHGRVIHMIENLAPFRIAALRRHASSVLELPVRTIYCSNTQVGDELMICTLSKWEEVWGPAAAKASVAKAESPPALEAPAEKSPGLLQRFFESGNAGWPAGAP